MTSTCITGIIRLLALRHLRENDISCMSLYPACPLTSSHGKADSFTTEYLWSQVEPATAILCACMVTYRPLFREVKVGFSRLFSTHSWSSTPESDQGGDLDSAENGQMELLSVKKVQLQDGSRLRELNDEPSKASSTSSRPATHRVVDEASASWLGKVHFWKTAWWRERGSVR